MKKTFTDDELRAWNGRVYKHFEEAGIPLCRVYEGFEGEAGAGITIDACNDDALRAALEMLRPARAFIWRSSDIVRECPDVLNALILTDAGHHLGMNFGTAENEWPEEDAFDDYDE